MNWPNKPPELPTLLGHPEPYTLSWDSSSRTISQTIPSIITDAIIYKSNLMAAKVDMLIRLTNMINYTRMSVLTGFDQQDTIYINKAIQAQAFKDVGYSSNRMDLYHHVMIYADLTNISYKEAADSILLSASLTNQMLAKTEYVRMKFISKLRDMTDILQMSEFHSELTDAEK